VTDSWRPLAVITHNSSVPFISQFAPGDNNKILVFPRRSAETELLNEPATVWFDNTTAAAAAAGPATLVSSAVYQPPSVSAAVPG